MKDHIKHTIAEGRERHRNLILYGVIGLSGVLIDLIVFAVLVRMLEINPVIATLISTSCGITNNFILNAFYNFKKRDHLIGRFVSFYSVGTIGIVASALVLLICSDIFRANPTLVKIVSIPPIVFGQYLLNKHLSFGKRLPSVDSFMRLLYRNHWLVLVNMAFVTLTVTLAIFLPMVPGGNGAPDEHQHYSKNVDFILQHHRLPVSGQDDVDAMMTCRDNQYGQVPCLYSYQINPAFNYIVSAVTTKAGSIVGVGGITGARLASVLWGLVFINSIYLIGRLFLRRNQAILLTLMTGFIPQVLFVSSYVNQDIHSLAIAALLVYSSLAYVHFGRERLRWLFYVSFGLLFVAKYNYFITMLVPASLLLRAYWRRKTWPRLSKELGIMAGVALLISGFWYVRNYWLYGDALGQNFVLHEMAKYHPLGHQWSLFDLDSYALLFRFDFFDTLFKSFFATFGYMNIYLEGVYYAIVKLALVVGTGFLALYAGIKGRLVLLLGMLFGGLALLQAIANSFTYDFQAQGRYMFVVLPVAAVVLAYGLKKIDTKRPQLVQGVFFAGTALTIWLVWQSVLVIGKAFAAA